MCELIRCAGEESVGLYRQISTVRHPQPVIEVNYKCDRPMIRIEPLWLSCDFVPDFVEIFNSDFSVHAGPSNRAV